MGALVSSRKVESSYVLRVQDDSDLLGPSDLRAVRKPEGEERHGASRRGSKVLGDKQASKAALAAQSSAVLQRSGSTAALTAAAVAAAGAISTSGGGGGGGAGAGAGNGGIIKRRSTAGYGGSSRQIICSDTLPWLIKYCKFESSQLTDFEFGRVIGQGLMGTVRVAKTKSTEKYFVIKSLRKDYVKKHHDERHVNSEREVLSTLKCSFCVRLFGTFQDKDHLHFALEFAPGGELFHRLGKKKAFPPDVAKFYLSEIFIAVEHVQSFGFVYRDLKPENVVLDEEGHCKLVDFGFTTSARAKDGMLRTLCGTPAYLSPEQLDGKFTNGYTKIVDWWSFGVLCFELLTGKTPFCSNPRDSHYEIFLRILNNKISFPRSMDGPSKELISQLCCPQVPKRLCEPEDIRKHPYFHIPWEAVANRLLVPPFVPRIKDEGDTHYFDKYPERPFKISGNGNDLVPKGYSIEFPDF